ncbi:hypothetical protein Sked_24420 [Sanguibacter keddieii DSM 10542]|uniref:Uncharacterized protein n=1 Tax=Sanguibacter keddieii (strain ATCC 51767 / DSM 10542 / NCFB 3025 / ST-74) TaxID=446469 RepID=D1BJU5_SANKS|nr:hypothetical protein [Sanguibacter keddieii]ACZ22354.1 hypothetical protein Sked_24420 [Sanguibacter keddieii DSM 10542]
MNHRTLAALALASLVALSGACSSAADTEAPDLWVATEVTVPPTAQERIDAAKDPRPRPPRASQPTSADLWRSTLDAQWFDLGVEGQAEICDSWRTLGNAEAHTLLLVPDTISAYEVGEKLEGELCLDYPG